MLPIRAIRKSTTPPAKQLPDGFYERVFKGDLPGHPFRGNQYTDVVGGKEITVESVMGDLSSLTGRIKPHLGRPSPKTPNVRTLDEALALAASDAAAFKGTLEDFASRTGGRVVYPGESFGGALKSRSSAQEKLTRSGKTPSQLNDLVRATVEYPTLEKVYEGTLSAVKEYGDKLEQVDDKISMPTPMGYRDVSIKVRNPNGSVGEVIISTPEILKVKETVGHKLYEENREIEVKMKEQGRRGMWPDEEALSDVNTFLSRKAYDEAIVEGVRRSKKK